MSSSLARLAGLLSIPFLTLAFAPARADVPIATNRPAAVNAQAWDDALVAEVQARLRQAMPDESIEVRSANAGLVLSGQISSPESLNRALALAEGHAPGRVSNLMTVGRLPQIELSLRLAEMPRAVARNLSASMGMAGMFAPASPGEAGALPGLIDALEAKGVLRPIASATLTATAGRVTHLPTGSGCSNPVGHGIGMDVTPVLAEDGAIAVTLRTCVPGKAEGVGDNTVTILLKDGQTFAVDNVLPDLLRDPGAYNSALASEPTLAPLLSSADYREGRSEVMILISARISTSSPVLSGDLALPPIGTVVQISEPASQGKATEAFTLSHRLLP